MHTAPSLSAITLHSSSPDALARFYRDVVGLPFALARHGTLADHHEAFVNGIHFAIWKASEDTGGPVVPVFRVPALDPAAARLAALHVPALHEPLALDDDMRVVTFRDPDGNAFRLIEIRGERTHAPGA